MAKEITIATKRICAKVRSVREDKGLSQSDVANNAGVFREAVTRLERGNISPSVDLLARVLEPMGYTIDIVRIEDVE